MMKITHWLKTFLLAILLLEFIVFILVAKQFGFFWALLLIIVGIYCGVKILRKQFSSNFASLHTSLITGQLPTGLAKEKTLTIIGALLLIFPGFITDLIGLFCLLPALKQGLLFRHAAEPELAEFEEIDVTNTSYTKSSRVIEGEFVHEKDDK